MNVQHTRAAVALGVVIAVALAIGAVAARGAQAGNSATEWNLTAVDTLVNLPGPAGGAPPSSQVNVAMVQGAVYDAVNAIDAKRYRPYLLTRRFSPTASKDAAVATAAYTVLAHIVATVPASIPFAGKDALLQSLASRYAASLAAIPNSSAKTQGIAAGNAAAQAMTDARLGDGRFGPSQWVPNSAPGHWQPLAGPTGPILDPTPWVGNVRPFLLQSPSQFRTPGPLALSSAAWAQDFNEVKLIGSVNSAVRTPTQTYIARWWQSNPVASWNDVARQLVPAYGFDLADTARLLAMENLSAADAAINCWNDKYFWDFWRPWNAIPRAAEDGNPATAPDPTWTALITAPYPDHPSGHLCLDASHTRVLQMVFGADVPPGGFQITSVSTLLNPVDLRTRSFSSFSQTIAEIVEARIWAGLHYRTADVQSVTLGWNVADYMAANYFQRLGSFGGG